MNGTANTCEIYLNHTRQQRLWSTESILGRSGYLWRTQWNPAVPGVRLPYSFILPAKVNRVNLFVIIEV